MSNRFLLLPHRSSLAPRGSGICGPYVGFRHASTAYDMDGKIPIYDWDQIQSRDPYEFFLSGASPVQYLENVDASTERELVIFRDSFGSSLAPLLVSGYRKITLIDLRYVSSDLLDQLVTFEEQDVLFLYSTLLWNQSGTIK